MWRVELWRVELWRVELWRVELWRVELWRGSRKSPTQNFPGSALAEWLLKNHRFSGLQGDASTQGYFFAAEFFGARALQGSRDLHFSGGT